MVDAKEKLTRHLKMNFLRAKMATDMHAADHKNQHFFFPNIHLACVQDFQKASQAHSIHI